MNRLLQSYKDEKRGPTLVTIQSPNDLTTLASQIQLLNGNFFHLLRSFNYIYSHVLLLTFIRDSDTMFTNIETVILLAFHEFTSM